MQPFVYSSSNKLPTLHQSEAAECGLACLAMVCGYHGYKTDLTSLRRRFPVSLKGATLQNLMAIADQLGMAARPLRAELDGLGTTLTPRHPALGYEPFCSAGKSRASACGHP